MIENKEEYLAKWQTLFDKQNDVLNDLAEANEMLEKYGAVNLGELVDRLQEEADKATEEFNEYTKEEKEIIDKIHSEFSAAQIEAWIAQGYSHIDMVYAYLQGKIDDYKRMHNFFTEAKNELGVSGKISEMSREIDKMVTRKTKELARKYVNDTVIFKDAEHVEPDAEVHYKISWGSENHDNVSEVWEDAVFMNSTWGGLYCKNLATDDACDEFEYIKEIRRLPTTADGTETK